MEGHSNLKKSSKRYTIYDTIFCSKLPFIFLSLRMEVVAVILMHGLRGSGYQVNLCTARTLAQAQGLDSKD